MILLGDNWIFADVMTLSKNKHPLECQSTSPQSQPFCFYCWSLSSVEFCFNLQRMSLLLSFCNLSNEGDLPRF